MRPGLAALSLAFALGALAIGMYPALPGDLVYTSETQSVMGGNVPPSCFTINNQQTQYVCYNLGNSCIQAGCGCSKVPKQVPNDAGWKLNDASACKDSAACSDRIGLSSYLCGG